MPTKIEPIAFPEEWDVVDPDTFRHRHFIRDLTDALAQEEIEYHPQDKRWYAVEYFIVDALERIDEDHNPLIAQDDHVLGLGGVKSVFLRWQGRKCLLRLFWHMSTPHDWQDQVTSLTPEDVTFALEP